MFKKCNNNILNYHHNQQKRIYNKNKHIKNFTSITSSVNNFNVEPSSTHHQRNNNSDNEQCNNNNNNNRHVHPTAIIHPNIHVPRSTSIGPYTVINSENVIIGENCTIKSHVNIEGNTTIGDDCTIFPYAAIGGIPQDKKFNIGDETMLDIGNSTTIREHVTINTGTLQGGNITSIGRNCLLMAAVHIGHDTIIGNQVTIANGTCLAGHVHVDDYATIGGLCGIKQRLHIGTLSMIGGGTVVDKNVLPYSLMFGNRGRLHGINLVGLKRFGYSTPTIQTILRTFRYLFPNTPVGKNASIFARPLDLPKETKIVDRIEHLKNYILNNSDDIDDESLILINELINKCVL